MFKVSKVKFEKDIKTTIKQSVDLLGGFSKFVRPGEVVFLKPNFNSADPYPASTDIEFLKNIVELIYEAGAKLVIIGESSMYTLNTRKVLEQCGVFKLEETTEAPPRVYVLDEMKWVKKSIPQGRYIKSASLPEILGQADKLILLPNLKTHFKARFTGAIKISMGLMKPSERVGFHLGNLEEKIAELNTLIKPDLIVMDGRICFITGGPFDGERREPNLVLASDDRVAIDIEGIKILQNYKGNNLEGVSPWELKQIKCAVELGLGVKNSSDYEVAGD